MIDSSVVIEGERQGQTVHHIPRQLNAEYGELELGLSVGSIVELVHGVQRAVGQQRRQRRQAFVDELIRDVPVHPITLEIGKLAGRIEGERATHGVTIAFEDLLIGATALHLGFAVVTGNFRHFSVIPGLSVVSV